MSRVRSRAVAGRGDSSDGSVSQGAPLPGRFHAERMREEVGRRSEFPAVHNGLSSPSIYRSTKPSESPERIQADPSSSGRSVLQPAESSMLCNRRTTSHQSCICTGRQTRERESLQAQSFHRATAVLHQVHLHEMRTHTLLDNSKPFNFQIPCNNSQTQGVENAG